MSWALAVPAVRNAAKSVSATKFHPPSRTRGDLTLSARLRLAAGPAAARERSASLSLARFDRPTSFSAESSAREAARPVVREACAGLRVAQGKIRPNRQRRRHQWLAADPWRPDGGDNSILRSR